MNASGDRNERDRDVHDARHVVSWTFAAMVLCQGAGVPWSAPVAGALPLALHLRGRTGALPAMLVWRWTVTLFLTALAMLGLGGTRALRSVPAGEWAAGSVRAWLEGSGGAFPSPAVLVVAVAACAAATIPARGVAGVFVLAELLAATAAAAVAVYARSFNVFESTLVAVAPWTACAIAGCVVALAPLSTPGTSGRAALAAPPARRTLAAAAILVAAAVLLRLAAAPAFTRLARDLTLP